MTNIDKAKKDVASVATSIVKDLSLMNFIENCCGDSPVSAFFRCIDDAAALGNWRQDSHNHYQIMRSGFTV